MVDYLDALLGYCSPFHLRRGLGTSWFCITFSKFFGDFAYGVNPFSPSNAWKVDVDRHTEVLNSPISFCLSTESSINEGRPLQHSMLKEKVSVQMPILPQVNMLIYLITKAFFFSLSLASMLTLAKTRGRKINCTVKCNLKDLRSILKLLRGSVEPVGRCLNPWNEPSDLSTNHRARQFLMYSPIHTHTHNSITTVPSKSWSWSVHPLSTHQLFTNTWTTWNLALTSKTSPAHLAAVS